MNPDLDLTLQRVIRGPSRRRVAGMDRPVPARAVVGTRPDPVPASTGLSVRPGGALVTRLSDDGVEFVPHIDASFLVVDELERLAFTNAVDSQWRPANPDPVAMVAEIPSTTTRTAPTTGSSSATVIPPLANATRRSASSTAGGRSPSSSPRSWRRRRRNEDRDHRVRHSRRRQPGPRFPDGGHQ